MDPSFLQLSRTIHQERLEAANKQDFREGPIARPNLKERILSSIGDGLILVGQKLKAGLRKDSIKSISTDMNQAKS